jgi:hypothetical protein
MPGLLLVVRCPPRDTDGVSFVTSRQISSSAVADAEFRYSDLLPTGQDVTSHLK